MKTCQELLQIVEEQAKAAFSLTTAPTPDEDLFMLGDSLDMVRLVVKLEEHFDMTLPDNLADINPMTCRVMANTIRETIALRAK